MRAGLLHIPLLLFHPTSSSYDETSIPQKKMDLYPVVGRCFPAYDIQVRYRNDIRIYILKQYTFMRYIHCMPRPRVEYTRPRDRRDWVKRGKRTDEIHMWERWIVEFVGLVYMCEVRGQNKTKKTNEKHRSHEVS
jgi:hypothetical protein